MIRGIDEGKFNIVVGLRVDVLFCSMRGLATHAQFFRDHKTGKVKIYQSISIDPEWKNQT